MNEEKKAPERVALSRYANGGMTMTAPDGSNPLNRAWSDRYVRADIHAALEAERDEAVRKRQAMSSELTDAYRERGPMLDQALALLPDSRMLLDQAASLIELLQGPSVGSEKLRALRDRITAFLELIDVCQRDTNSMTIIDSLNEAVRILRVINEGQCGCGGCRLEVDGFLESLDAKEPTDAG